MAWQLFAIKKCRILVLKLGVYFCMICLTILLLVESFY